MLDLSPEDQYQLRKALMDADKKALEPQRAQQELERFTLEVEYKFGLLAEGKTLDPRTANCKEVFSVRKGNGTFLSEAWSRPVPCA